MVGKGRRVPTAEGNLARMALHMALYLLKYPQAPQYVIFNFTMTVPCPVPLFRSLARSLSSSPLQNGSVAKIDVDCVARGSSSVVGW